MQFPSFIRPLFVSVAALALAAGCTRESPSARAPQAAARSLGRGDAIAEAERDAAQSFGERAASAQAERVGGLWIVELRRANGGLLRYAISTQDGSIRERNMFQ